MRLPSRSYAFSSFSCTALFVLSLLSGRSTGPKSIFVWAGIGSSPYPHSNGASRSVVGTSNTRYCGSRSRYSRSTVDLDTMDHNHFSLSSARANCLTLLPLRRSMLVTCIRCMRCTFCYGVLEPCSLHACETTAISETCKPTFA